MLKGYYDIAYLECKVKASCNPGNHTLFIGEVVNSGFISDKTPLSSADYEGVYLGKS
ncbi:MAG: flavin reductase family protein [Desulfobacterales bacterium]|nr:flavin reductase family protein [Desulfobacterales bacterium]